MIQKFPQNQHHSCASPRHSHQWFLTWLSVRPGRCLAISAQRFPSSRCCLLRVTSSSSDHSHLRIVGSASKKKNPGCILLPHFVDVVWHTSCKDNLPSYAALGQERGKYSRHTHTVDDHGTILELSDHVSIGNQGIACLSPALSPLSLFQPLLCFNRSCSLSLCISCIPIYHIHDTPFSLLSR